MQVRLEKEVAVRFVVEFAPQYAEILRDFERQGKWLKLPEPLSNIRENLKIHNYVELYNDEQRILIFLFLSFLGKDGLKKFSDDVAARTREERVKLLHELVHEVRDFDIETYWPDSDEAKRAVKAEFDRLSKDEKAEIIKRCQFFWSFFFAQFHNMLSLMIHGAKLSDLVPQAIAGDQEAFCKAIQIDRSLTTHHPYFRQRRLEALEKGETDFLSAIAYRETNPTFRGKIRYPGVYMVFACLDAAQWLDDVTHEKILDICDEAGLHRYQNRIDDVNSITKRLQGYRRMQKRGGLSMQ